MEMIILCVYIAFSSSFNYVNTPQPCTRGERMHISEEGFIDCLECEGGTYMPVSEHTFETCINCTQIGNPDLDILVIPCNRFHDAMILCINGYYRHTAQHFRDRDWCEKCSQCQFPEQERGCHGYSDTVCCDSNQEADATKAGAAVCKERLVVCGVGQFLRTSSNECFPCPAGTFMSDHNHTNKNCLKCEELSGSTVTHAVITRPCSRTAPTLFGCKDGYFRDPTQESLQIEVPCTQCRSCYRSLTECGMFHDAVCDDKNKMTTPAAGNPTQSTGTPEVADTITHLNTSLNESLASCILHCMGDGFATTARSESSTWKCLLFCLPEPDKANLASAWLRAFFCIILFALFDLKIWLMQKTITVDNIINILCRIFTYALYAFNVLCIILLIINALLESKVIEDQGHWGIVLTVICYIVLIVNLALVLFFVRNDRPKHARNRNANKVVTRGKQNNAENQQFVPAMKQKENYILIQVQTDESASCDSSF